MGTRTGNSKKSKKKAWRIFAYILLAVQIILSIVALVELLVSKMLPTTYLLLFVVVIWLMLFLAFTLMVLVRKRKGQPKKQLYLKRGLGTVLSAFTIIVCMLITHYIGILNTTIGNITQEKVIVTNTIAVYVPIGSSAEKIQDAADENFGYASDFDYENSIQAVEVIEEEVGQEIATAEYDTVFDAVDALYRGEIGAMILNYSYEEIISDMDGYEDFTSLTKIIYEHEIETVVEQPEVEEPVDVTNDVFVVYLSGSDTRSAKLSTSRSDVNILAFVNPTNKQVLLLNTPRDYYVPISISSSGTRDKLTHCGIYGVDCSMDTLGALYDTSVDYYMQVNFEGFKTLVDAIGGIEVESDQSFVTLHYDVQINKGINYLDGTGALGFVRERYAFSDGDNARGRNTMKVIKAIIDKMSSGTTILSNYSAIMKSMEGMFVTNMSSDEIADLVRMQLSDMSSWDVRQYAVTGTGDSRTTYSVPNQNAYVMIPNEDSVDKAKELIDKMESGELLTDADFE
jgi:LCP family protein required for cell wall assembly